MALLALLAAGGEPKIDNPVLPNEAELFWGTILFLVLLILMWKVLLPPIKKAMRQREVQIRSDAEAAQKALADAEQVRRDYDATLAEARVDAGRVLEEARAAGEATRADLVRAADAEIAERRAAATAELEAMRREAITVLTGEVGGIAVEAASRVVGRPLDTAANQPVVDEYVRGAALGRA